MSGDDRRSPPSEGRPWGVIEIVDDISRVAAEWDALADRVGADPFARPGWVSAWWTAFGGEGRLGVIALHGGGRMRALAPLVRRAAVTRSPTNDHSPRFAFLGEDAAALQEMAEIVLRLRQRRLVLAPLDASGDTIAALRRAGGPAGYRMVERVKLRSPYRALPAGADAESLLDSKMRKELRRCRRRLQEQGDLELRVEHGDGDLEGTLAEAFAIEALQWKGSAGTAIASSPQTLRFYRDVARWAASRGTLRLASMRLDGRMLAFELAIAEGGGIHGLKAGFDPVYGRHSPGHLLTLNVIDAGIAAGARSYELLGDADPYKMRWADDIREMVSLEASAPGVRGALDHLNLRYGRRAVGGLHRRISLGSKRVRPGR